MVNCNPETVSTDYDTSDRLYFEPLTDEDVMEIIRVEQQAGTLKGVIVQFGGQTPLKLARAIKDAGAAILGTPPEAIDRAEDRDHFKMLVDRLDLRQPKNGIASSIEQAKIVAGEIGYPLVIRPSYVLGGRAMAIIYDETDLKDYIEAHTGRFRAARPAPEVPGEHRARERAAGDQRAPVRHLSARRDRSRRRRHCRWRGRLHLRDHGAYRGGGRAFRGLGLLAAAPFASARNAR